MKESILKVGLCLGLLSFGLDLNASCDGNTYTVFNADQGELFQQAGQNCCAGDEFEIVDIGTGNVTKVKMLSSGPDATCD